MLVASGIRSLQKTRFLERPDWGRVARVQNVAVRLWIDVEDLFEYARTNRRPSGIQRLAFEICQALQMRDGGSGQVRFVRHAF
jgi:hypothetical protein